MSLLRTAARASVAARVVGNVQRRQQRNWAQQDEAAMQRAAAGAAAAGAVPAAAPAPVAPVGAAVVSQQQLIDELKQLAQLRDSGVLTETEFETQKRRLLEE